jgi:hypothetical protein
MRWLFALWSVVAALMVPALARAQQATINQNAVPHLHGDGPVSNGVASDYINRQDCLNDAQLTIPLYLTGIPNTQQFLMAWAGTADCTAQAARQVPTNTCWKVLASPIQQIANPNIHIRVQDLVQWINPTTTLPAQYQAAGPEACNNPNIASGGAPVTIYFMFLSSDTDNSAVGTAKYTIPVILRGPAPPSNVTAAIGDTALILNWSPSSDPSILGYQVFVDPPPNGQTPAPTSPADASAGQLVCITGVTDGGVDEAGNHLPGVRYDAGCYEAGAGSSAGGGAASTCPSTVIVSGNATTSSNGDGGTVVTGGTLPPSDPAYSAGGPQGQISNSFTASGLQNGVEYTVAVAGVDKYHNIGPLSAPACETPQPVNDFWKVYREDGGQAGGGFCALEAPGMPAGTTPLLILAAFGLIAWVRRKGGPRA